MALARVIRLGTRASLLARRQAEWVALRLRELGAEVHLVPITTMGDRHAERSIRALPARGVFTRQLQAALLSGRIDLAVHSLKDLPTEPVPGLCLAAVPERASVAEVLISAGDVRLEGLPVGAVVGTGSLRRRAQLLHVRPDLRMMDIRGNVDTRLRKLDRGDFDALVLAEAGLGRLGLSGRTSQVLPPELVLPAVGQGALGLEVRDGELAILELVRGLNDPPSEAAVVAERSMLAALQGGCLAPVAAWGRIEDGRLVLSGRVLRPDGQQTLDAQQAAEPSQAVQLGRRVAEALLAQGAAALIRAARQPG
ncbi:MAG: hydroxymethylbilane synthase [Thermoguttaceae bacterium]